MEVNTIISSFLCPVEVVQQINSVEFSVYLWSVKSSTMEQTFVEAIASMAHYHTQTM